MHDVSDVLTIRAQQLEAFSKPIAASMVVHVVVLAALALAPAAWFAAKEPEKTITINLGSGALGPERSGMTATGGRQVDVIEPPKPREPIPPAAPPKAAEFVPAAPSKPAPEKPADKSASFVTPKAATGAQIQKGTALIETGAKGLAVGLSAGGLGGVQSDADFCCKDYLTEITSGIAARWISSQGIEGTVIMEFVVEKDGRVADITFKQKTGLAQLDLAAERALTGARVPPLPSRYPGQRLYITLAFPYKR